MNDWPTKNDYEDEERHSLIPWWEKLFYAVLVGLCAAVYVELFV